MANEDISNEDERDIRAWLLRQQEETGNPTSRRGGNRMGTKKPTTTGKTVRTGKTARTQTEMEGMERTHDAELAEAAESLHKVRTKKVKLREDETKAEAALLALMRSKKVTTYIDDELGLKATMKHRDDKVSVVKLTNKEKAAAPPPAE